MEAICSCEISVDFQRTTRRYIPEDSTLHNHRCEDLKSYNSMLFRNILKRPFWIYFAVIFMCISWKQVKTVKHHIIR
jgi:hypothetical protein